MSDLVFNAYSQYYDLLYKDKDYQSEVAYIRKLLQANGISQGRILEFGSGTGKHGNLLAAGGFSVHGIELSKEMVNRAQLVPGFTCQQGDIARTFMNRKYDAVLSLFHVLSYQTTNDRLLSVINNAAMHLNPGGIFIVDFWYTPAVFSQQPSVRVKRMEDESLEIVRIAEPVNFPNENRVDVNYTIYARNLVSGVVTRLQETHSMRHLSLPELDLLVSSNGFEIIRIEEFLSGEEISESTWGVCAILKRT